MKRIHIFFFVVIGTLYSLSLHGENMFYYGNEEKIPITVLQNKRTILHQPVREKADYIERIGARIQIVPVEPSSDENSKIMYETDNNKHDGSTDYHPLLENTSWTNVSYYLEPPMSASLYKTQGDTLIAGKSYKIIRPHVINVDDAIIYPNANSITATQYWYEDIETRRVYRYNEYYKRDVLMYDFSLHEGDKLITDSTKLATDTLFTLRNISSIENSGFTYKQYTFIHEPSDTIIWLEGIGNIIDVTIPQALQQNKPYSRLLCVQKEDVTIYDTGNFRGKTCEDINLIYDEYSRQSLTDTPIHTPSATKILRDGQIYILRGEKTYTTTGQEVK